MANQRFEGRRNSRRRWPCLPLALAVIVLLGGGLTPGRASASPVDRQGMWIWYVSASGGSAAAIADKARRFGIGTVYVKSSDGDDWWSQFSPALVRGLHKRGLDVCAWAFVYGEQAKAEARLSARAAEYGADCVVIDAESAYEGRYAEAYRYISRLRRAVGPRYRLGLSSFPYADYHPSFPYSVFLGRGGAQLNLPQVYWHAIGDPVARSLEHTYRWNMPYGRRIYPVGQTYGSPPRRELLDFRKYAREYEAPAVSWWSWQETTRRQWGLVGERLRNGVPGFEAEREYADLTRGDRGDLVVLAQELLRAWNAGTKVDGDFDRGLRRAVERFQQQHGLRPTGDVGDRTWRLLTRREPQSTNWARKPSPRQATALRHGAVPSDAAVDSQEPRP